MRFYIKGFVELFSETADEAMEELGDDWKFELVDPFHT